MSDLRNLVNRINLHEEIQVPTEIRKPLGSVMESVGLNALDFSNDPDPNENVIEFEQPIHTPVVEEVQEDDYDAEKNARGLVYTLLSVDQVILNIAVIFKARASVGGSKGIELMKEARTKDFNGEELTEVDKKRIQRFEDYKRDMEMLSAEIYPKPDEINRLIETATDWCEESKVKIGSAAAFWSNYASSVVTRVSSIAMKKL